MSLIDLVPLGALGLFAVLMYRDGYRLRWTRSTAAVLATAAGLAYAGWFLLPQPADAVLQLTWYLGLVYLFVVRSSASLVADHRGHNDDYRAKLLRVDEDIRRAHLDAIERGTAGQISEAEIIDIYRRAVDQLRLLEPPSRTWQTLTSERIAIHERNLAFLSAPEDFEGRISANKVESEAWHARVTAQRTKNDSPLPSDIPNAD